MRGVGQRVSVSPSLEGKGGRRGLQMLNEANIQPLALACKRSSGGLLHEPGV